MKTSETLQKPTKNKKTTITTQNIKKTSKKQKKHQKPRFVKKTF